MDRHPYSATKNHARRRPARPKKPSPPALGRSEPHPAQTVDITAMIRSLQRSAGMADCFKSGIADCDSTECHWRAFCLEPPQGQTTRPPGGAK